MQEIERVKQNNKGEIPEKQKTSIHLKNIKNPKSVLEVAKGIIIAFLENSSLEPTDEQWQEIFPEKVIKFISQLNDEDYGNDHILFPLELLIVDLKEKEWEWYSSKLFKDGFEIITTKSFLPRYSWIFHCQNIPLSDIWIDDDRYGKYGLRTLKDVTTYKKFDL